MEFLEIQSEQFHELYDKFRSNHLWVKREDKWYLRYTVCSDEQHT